MKAELTVGALPLESTSDGQWRQPVLLEQPQELFPLPPSRPTATAADQPEDAAIAGAAQI